MSISPALWDSVYCSGYLSHESGLDISNNPYAVSNQLGSMGDEAWRLGWYAANMERSLVDVRRDITKEVTCKWLEAIQKLKKQIEDKMKNKQPKLEPEPIKQGITQRIIDGMTRRAYANGMDARLRGDELDTNPYANTASGSEWEAGWTDIHKQIMVSMPDFITDTGDYDCMLPETTNAYRLSGRWARLQGNGPGSCKFDKGVTAYSDWLKGWNEMDMLHNQFDDLVAGNANPSTAAKSSGKLTLTKDQLSLITKSLQLMRREMGHCLTGEPHIGNRKFKDTLDMLERVRVCAELISNEYDRLNGVGNKSPEPEPPSD